MITTVDERLRSEAKEFAFTFTCETCAHFAPDAGSCGNGYPTAPHRGIQLVDVERLAFCKDYELT